MRVTHKQITSRAVSDMRRALEAVGEKTTQVTTGKKVTRASDDSVSATQILNYRNKVSRNSQHGRNAQAIRTHLVQTDTVLSNVQTGVGALQEIGTWISGGGLSESERIQVLSEMDELKSEFMTLANTKIGEVFIFSGTKATTPTYLENDGRVVFNGNSDLLFAEIGTQSTIQVNTTAEDVFGTSGDDVFAIIDQLKAAFLVGDRDEIAKIAEKSNQFFDKVVETQSRNALRIQRVEIATDRLSEDSASLEDVASTLESVDLPVASTELIQLQTSYQMTLSAVGRSIQKSLLDVIG